MKYIDELESWKVTRGPIPKKFLHMKKEYMSETPTKEKKELYHFMEQTKEKSTGNIAVKKFSRYTREKGYKAEPTYGSQSINKKGNLYVTIKNKKGTPLAETEIKKDKYVVWWHVK